MSGRPAGRGGGGAGGGFQKGKVMLQPISQIFRFLQNQQRIEIWLFEQVHTRIEGTIVGFDEYMNVVLDDAYEITGKEKQRKGLGRILLKGENITLIQNAGAGNK